MAGFAGAASLAGPASADTSVPVYMIESIGDRLATCDRLTLDGVVIGYAGPARTLELTLTFDVVDSGSYGKPFHFLSAGNDPACALVGGAPNYTLACHYTRQAQTGTNLFPFSIAQPISRPVNHPTGGLPNLKLTVEVGEITMSRYLEAGQTSSRTMSSWIPRPVTTSRRSRSTSCPQCPAHHRVNCPSPAATCCRWLAPGCWP